MQGLNLLLAPRRLLHRCTLIITPQTLVKMGERCNGVTVCEGLDAYPGLTSGGNIIHIMYSYQYRFDSFFEHEVLLCNT